MDKHAVAGAIENAIATFHQIKTESSRQRIEQLCDSGITKLYDFSGSAMIQKELDAIRSRRIDPMA